MAGTEERTTPTALQVVREYFDAVAARDTTRMAACWDDEGVEHVAGMFDVVGGAGVKAAFDELFSAMPDLDLVVTQTVTQRDRVAVHWTATGTFSGGPFQGIAPTGTRVELEGLDLLRVVDGLIVRNDAYLDGTGFATQLGLMPPKGSKQEARLLGAFNAKTRLAAKVCTGPEQIAEDVWIVRGGWPKKTFNVYLVRDGDGVLAYDAGSAQMANGIAMAAAQLGGLTKVVLGHAHPDHRGAAPALKVPVWCHELERPAAEGDGGMSTIRPDELPVYARPAFRKLLPVWDGGPVQVAGTLAEGDEVGDGFRVVHVPGHAPGMIALFRERDRLALTSDAFYTVDVVTTKKGGPRIPHAAFTPDRREAAASIRKLAALEPAAAWPGHADPVVGDVRAQLLAAADAG